MHAHTYTHYEHTVLTADERSYFRTRMLNESLGMLGGAALVFASATFVGALGLAVAGGLALIGSVVFVRSLAHRAEDYMAVNDIYSASEH